MPRGGLTGVVSKDPCVKSQALGSTQGLYILKCQLRILDLRGERKQKKVDSGESTYDPREDGTTDKHRWKKFNEDDL